jgi:hypothetical protein
MKRENLSQRYQISPTRAVVKALWRVGDLLLSSACLPVAERGEGWVRQNLKTKERRFYEPEGD